MSIILPPLFNLGEQPKVACVFAEFRSGTRTQAQFGEVCPLPVVVLPTDVIYFIGYCNNGFPDSSAGNPTPVFSGFSGDQQTVEEVEVSGRRHSMMVVRRVNIANAAAIQPADRQFAWFVSVTSSRWLVGTLVFRGARVGAGSAQPDLSQAVNVVSTATAPTLSLARTQPNQVAVSLQVIGSVNDRSLPQSENFPLPTHTQPGAGTQSILRLSFRNFDATGTSQVPARLPAPGSMPASALIHLTPI